MSLWAYATENSKAEVDRGEEGFRKSLFEKYNLSTSTTGTAKTKSQSSAESIMTKFNKSQKFGILKIIKLFFCLAYQLT